MNPQKSLRVNFLGTTSSTVKIPRWFSGVHCGCTQQPPSLPAPRRTPRRTEKCAGPPRQSCRTKARDWQTRAQVALPALTLLAPEHPLLPSNTAGHVLGRQLLLELRLVLLKVQVLYMYYYQRHRCYSLDEKTEVGGWKGFPTAA